MTELRFIEIERAGDIATVWLNRPERHNAMHTPLLLELQRAVDELSEDEGVRAVVLAGRGDSFCAGGDLAWMREQAAAPFELNLEDARQLGHTFQTVVHCRKPTIARVHGAAIGGGFGLVAACDLAIASRTAVFATPEARLGLTPSTIAPYVMAAIGERLARRYFLTGERIDALHAQRIGLIHEVAPPEALDQRLREMLAALLEGGPQAQEHCKWLLAELGGTGLGAEQLEETARSLASMRAGDEAREGIDAFFARRRPSWTKRP